MEVFVTLYKVVLTHMKAIERYFHAVQFITLSREVLTSAPLKVTKQELHKVLLVFFYLQKSICIFYFYFFGIREPAST